MKNKKHLATITILVKDRQTHAKDLNNILTENGDVIMARLGVNVAKSCVENCTGLITVAVEATTSQINSLTEQLNNLYGIVAKANIMTN